MSDQGLIKQGVAIELLEKEWHPSNPFPISSLTPSSAKKVWWKCSVDERHEWETRFFARSANGQGCPYCLGKKVLEEDSMAGRFPHLLLEWDYTKNGDLDPKTLACKSGKKAHWKCAKGHEWITSIRHRTSGGRKEGGTNCPYCSNQKVCEENSFLETHPHLMKQWHPTKNVVNPIDLVAGSHQKVWWKCHKGEDHEWEASLSQRTLKDTGCPCCSGRKVVLSNCLATTHPEIAKGWHPTKNSFTPRDITYSSNEVAWFFCLDDPSHEWKCKIYSRTRGDQCPFCASSKGEAAVREWLNKHAISFKEQHKIKDCANIRPLPFDFAIFSGSNCIGLIEYQGIHHYFPRDYFGGDKSFTYIIKNDKIKSEYCSNNNIPLLIIPYTELTKVPILLREFITKITA
jgi:Probable Zinc-ribbon domain